MVSDLNKNLGGSTDLAKKRHGSADLRTPIHPVRQFRDSSITNESRAMNVFYYLPCLLVLFSILSTALSVGAYFHDVDEENGVA